jgi:hypothetical protein
LGCYIKKHRHGILLKFTVPVFVPQSFKFALFQYYIAVKYSPPIEAGASFNPPNLAKDCILRASVSEAMGFL